MKQILQKKQKKKQYNIGEMKLVVNIPPETINLYDGEEEEEEA